jgi:hypothetical protein
VHQIKKISIASADRKCRRAAAPMRWMLACQINSPPAAILHNEPHKEGRSHKVLSIGFFALALLTGCGDNGPSNSDMIKQLSAEWSDIRPCVDFSITDFQKINGFQQPDGSYIDQVRYTLSYDPTSSVKNAYNTYYPKLVSLESEERSIGNSNNGKINADIAAKEDEVNQEIQAVGNELNVQMNSAISGGCSLNVLEGIFNIFTSSPTVTTIATPQRITLTRTIHFIKSDNGWVIQ